MRVIFLVLMALLLAACGTGLQLTAGNDLFDRLPGSEFVLHADLVIPPGQIRASFQGGERVNGAGEYEPRCELEVRDFAEQAQIIHAGSYGIVLVRGLDRYVVRPHENIQLAAAEVLQLASDGGDSQWFMRTYHMKLRSDVYPDAPVLVCGGAYNYAFYVRYPSLQEMRAALGGYADIRLR